MKHFAPKGKHHKLGGNRTRVLQQKLLNTINVINVVYYLLLAEDSDNAAKLCTAGAAWPGPVVFLCPALLAELKLCLVTQSPALQRLRGSRSAGSICILNEKAPTCSALCEHPEREQASA